MAAKTRAKKVWKIFRFQERFELPDNVRFDSYIYQPLKYIRDYVGSGQDDEAVNYKRQIMTCRTSLNRHKLLAVFSDLREIAANCSKCFRGYILDERFEPASVTKIAGWVGLNTSETCKILKELEQIGLIEKVSIPKFEPPVKGEGGGKEVKKQKSRARTCAHEQSREPFNKYKYKYKDKSGNGKKNKKKKKTGKPETKYKPETKSKPKKRKMQACTITSQKQRQADSNPNSNPNRNPNRNPIVNPTASDGRVGNYKPRSHTDPPLQSQTTQYKDPAQLGIVLQKLFNPEAEEFAGAVYRAIGTPYLPDNQEGRSEIACWKMAWAKAQMAGITPFASKALWDRTIREAGKLNCKRQRKSVKWKKSPEAVLRWMFDRFLKNAMQRACLVDDRRTERIEPGCAMGVG